MALADIQTRITAAEVAAGRPVGSTQLIAVSKVQPDARVDAVLQQGHRLYGENRVQEAAGKWPGFRDRFDNVSVHLIGPLQSNKARIIAENFCWIHSVDRLKIAERLSALRPSHLPDLNVCIQLNISDETSKSGVNTSELMSLAESIVSLPGLKLRGLMALPAPTDEFAQQRKDFRRLREFLDQLVSAGHDVDTLSMGTTNDMEAAIAEGATIVRIGTALFGPRL